jgi:hypothetical protein
VRSAEIASKRIYSQKNLTQRWTGSAGIHWRHNGRVGTEKGGKIEDLSKNDKEEMQNESNNQMP